MAVLVEVVMLPFESVEVTGSWTATGVVGSVVVGTDGAAMMILSVADVGGSEANESIFIVDCGAAGPMFTVELVLISDAAIGGFETNGSILVVGGKSAGTVKIAGGFTAVVVAAVGTRPGAEKSLNGAKISGVIFKTSASVGSTLVVDVLADATFCDSATGGCVLDADACIEVGT